MAHLRSKLLTLVPALTAIALAGLAAPARAQSLDSAIVSASSLSATQKDTLTAFVKEHMPGLASGEADRVKKARNALTQPLLENAVTVGFRSTLSELLVAEKLDALCKDKTELVAINALRLAGELTTPEARAMLLDGMADKRAAVRYASVFAAIRTFEQAAPASRFPAMNADGMTPLIEALSKAMTSEKEANIADAAARALLAASKIEKAKYESIRPAALQALTAGLTSKLKAASKDDRLIIETAQRAAASLRDDLSARGAQMPEDQRKLAVGLAGDMLACISRLVQSGGMPQLAREESKAEADAKKESRKLYSNAVTTAENIVLFALRASGQPTGTSTLGRSFEEASKDGDARFVVQFGDLASSTLAKPPFAFEPDRFKTK